MHLGLLVSRISHGNTVTRNSSSLVCLGKYAATKQFSMLQTEQQRKGDIPLSLPPHLEAYTAHGLHARGRLLLVIQVEVRYVALQAASILC